MKAYGQRERKREREREREKKKNGHEIQRQRENNCTFLIDLNIEKIDQMKIFVMMYIYILFISSI